MKHIIPAILFVTVVGATCRSGNFPNDAWGNSYLKDVPRATAYFEENAARLKMEPPPSDDSETTLNEVSYLKKIAEDRSARDIILITKENIDPYKRFFEVLEIRREDYPDLNNLIHRIASESYFPVVYFKYKFSRTRPYQIDDSLTTVIDGPPHASYPSGHATQDYLIAMILADIFPEDDPRAVQLFKLGKDIGMRREIAGVHYPSDTRAGVELASQLKPLIMEKSDFQQAFQAAKAEFIRDQPRSSTSSSPN